MVQLKEKYARNYSERSLFNKIKKYAQKSGIRIIYAVLLLFYVMQDKDTPPKAKLIIASALGYFIIPFDWIPDFIPVTGFTDDLSALFLAIQQTRRHIKEKHKEKAKEKLHNWFGNFSDNDLFDVNAV